MNDAVYFFFNDTATTEIYTLSLHDALPISGLVRRRHAGRQSFYRANSRPIGKVFDWAKRYQLTDPFGHGWVAKTLRSEEHTSELQSLTNLVCRLLLDKKKTRLHAHLRVRID